VASSLPPQTGQTENMGFVSIPSPLSGPRSVPQ
jgi:hypothetical protein